MVEIIVAIPNISESRAIFLLLCDHQDTELEQQEIDISVDCLIFTQKSISKDLWHQYIYPLQYGINHCGDSPYF